MPSTRDDWIKYRDELRDRLREEQDFVARAEAGQIKMRSLENDKWIDTTQRIAEQARAAVKVLNDIIGEIERSFL